MADSEFSEVDLGAYIAHEIRHAKDYDQTELSDKRTRALEYLRGEMNDTPSRANGSSVTSRDLSDTISWMLPGIMRVFLSSDRMAEYEPVIRNASDIQGIKQAEEFADQASDYVSHVFFKDNPGYRIVYNSTHDALLTAGGPVKHWWDETPVTEVSFHTRLSAEQLAELTGDEDVEILAQEKNPRPDIILDEMGQPVPIETFNVKIERVMQRGQIRVDSIEPENFLIDEGAVTIEDARFVAQRNPYATRSDLIEMGFDKEKVESLSGGNYLLDSEEGSARQLSGAVLDNNLLRSTQKIDLYECYLKIDVDGDGVSEMCRVYYAGDSGAGVVLDWEVWEDELPFSIIPCYPQPHRFDGESVADRVNDVQQVKTILLRQGLDNLYASNLPQREVEQGSVLNPDALVSPKFGGIIWKKPGSNPVVPHVIPFVADKVFAAIEYLDRVIEKRTGVSRTMMALDPEALQNQTATANQNARDAAYSQVELVARNMAELGWRRVFRHLLKLIVKHQDRPRVIRLRGKAIEMDPRHWNANMDVTVNTGLGTGSRDRDMAMLRLVLADQIAIMDRFTGAGFADEAIDMIPKIRSTLTKIAEAAGLRNPDVYYPEIIEGRLATMKQRAQQRASQPSEAERMKMAEIEAQKAIKQIELQAQGALEQQKLQITQQAEVTKAQGNMVKEKAQLDADMQVKAAERDSQILIKNQELAFEREKLAADVAMQNRDLAVKLRIAEMQAEGRENARREAARAGADGEGTARQ